MTLHCTNHNFCIRHALDAALQLKYIDTKVVIEAIKGVDPNKPTAHVKYINQHMSIHFEKDGHLCDYNLSVELKYNFERTHERIPSEMSAYGWFAYHTNGLRHRTHDLPSVCWIEDSIFEYHLDDLPNRFIGPIEEIDQYVHWARNGCTRRKKYCASVGIRCHLVNHRGTIFVTE